MKILLDTHVLIWLALDMLPPKAEKLIIDESNSIYFSTASIWEIVIKRNSDRIDFNVDPSIIYNSLLENDYNEIVINSKHSIAIGTLPMHHKDPFDRILLAQSIVENMSLLTADKKMAQYPASIILISK